MSRFSVQMLSVLILNNILFIGMDALKTIYQNILSQHISLNNFSPQIQKNVERIVSSALQLHKRVTVTFLPTAIKFHYIFNLRDLSNIFQGILFSVPESLKNLQDFIRLWLHEASRVYGDKFVDDKDMNVFTKMKFKIATENFDVSHVVIVIQWNPSILTSSN